MKIEEIDALYKDIPNNEKVLIDVKNIFNNGSIGKEGYRYWKL